MPNLKQEFHAFEKAVLAAKVLSYVTGRPIEIKRIPLEEIQPFSFQYEWFIESNVLYEGILLILRFDLAPPPNKPDWWDDAKRAFENGVLGEDMEYFFKMVRTARAIRFRREANEPIKKTIQRDPYQFEDAVSEWHRLREEEERRQAEADMELEERQAKALANDPHYEEDLRNARRAEFRDEQAEASDSSEEFSQRLDEWDEFWESKRN